MERRMTSDRSPAQVLTTLIGAVFILVGILGFIPGITSHLYGGLDFAGHNSQAKLFHVFQVSWLHNIVHIAFGLVGLAFARTTATARLSSDRRRRRLPRALVLRPADRPARRREFRPVQHGRQLASLRARRRDDRARVRDDARAAARPGHLARVRSTLTSRGGHRLRCRCWTRQVPKPTSGPHSLCSPRPEPLIEPDQLTPALRRAMLLLAASGDPHQRARARRTRSQRARGRARPPGAPRRGQPRAGGPTRGRSRSRQRLLCAGRAPARRRLRLEGLCLRIASRRARRRRVEG